MVSILKMQDKLEEVFKRHNVECVALNDKEAKPYLIIYSPRRIDYPSLAIELSQVFGKFFPIKLVNNYVDLRNFEGDMIWRGEWLN